MYRWLWVSLGVLLLDQFSKLLAVTYLSPTPQAVTAHFNLLLVYNKGAAFSLLAQAGGWQRWFFIVVSILIVWFLLSWLKKLPPEQKWSALAISLVIGGALGNLIDRIWLGYVIDFIDLYYQGFHWPTFNVADSAISLGALLLIGVAVADHR